LLPQIGFGSPDIRDMKSLKTIGIGYSAWRAEEFWSRYDRGAFKK
jgi:hypothetical protein